MPLTSTDKWKEIVADLGNSIVFSSAIYEGRPTLRGIRKCPKCQTVNGTRGNSCKNKNCDVVFRDIGAKKKANVDTCKLIPDLPNYQVFSVSLCDQGGSEYSNFQIDDDLQIPVTTHEMTICQAVSISQAPSSSTSPTPERIMPSLGFEQWLAGVNERINQMMNFKLSGTPEPLVYHVYNEFFDYLKERISNTGLKKRRLPNQTLLVHREDTSPKRSLTKYIWRITSLLQLLNIFNCNLVKLKTTQYFIKTGNSTYEEYDEWVVPPPPKEADEPSLKNNQPIAPILHSTYLKIGTCSQSDSNGMQKEYSFTIEWIPDFLPASKMGELTLRFEFGHSKQCTQRC